MLDDLDFDTPRHPTARIPILCVVCGKEGKVRRWSKDNDQAFVGSFSGPTMALIDFIAGKPHICGRCGRGR